MPRYLLFGSLLYRVSILGVAIVCNVPLNEALVMLEPSSTNGMV
ncbi:MAG: hypothetical protein AB1861_12160 [Cyanobacteriota bacterium]